MRKILLAGLAMVVCGPALAAGHPEAGQRIVERRCVTCHEGPDVPAASDVSPTLLAIARRHKQNRRWVHTWLSGPHPAMRGVDLTQQEIADVIAYLETLPAE